MFRVTTRRQARARLAAAQLQDCVAQAFSLAYGWHFFGYDAGRKSLRGLEGVFDAKGGTHMPLGHLEWASLTLEAP
jgi:hypothetical protein